MLLGYDYPLLGLFWTIAILSFWVTIVFSVIWAFVDNFRRHDHSGWAKAGLDVGDHRAAVAGHLHLPHRAARPYRLAGSHPVGVRSAHLTFGSADAWPRPPTRGTPTRT